MPASALVALLSPAQGLAAFELGAAAFLAAVADADPAAPVPTCPGWTIADLVGHAGAVHRWACEAIRTGRACDEPEPPAAGLHEWYAESAALLAATLRATDPDAPAWGFGPRPRTARFWFRRQAHEIAVHLADAQAATGRPRECLPDDAALDGVDEVVTVFYPRQVRLGRIEPPRQALTLRCGGHAWTVGGENGVNRENRGDGAVGGRGGDGAAAACVTGPPGAVHLLLWNRIGLDDERLAVTGDPQAARAVLAAGIVP